MKPKRCAPLICLTLAACAVLPDAGPIASAGTAFPTAALAPAVTPSSTAAPTLPSSLPLAAGDWLLGPTSAPVTLVVYVDFQSPGSAVLAPTLAELHRNHPQDLRIVYRPFPLLTVHDKASLAGQAAEAAGTQGDFWGMHDLLFQRWDEWTELSPEFFLPWLVTAAGELGLDPRALNHDLTSGRYAALMNEAFEQGFSAGIPGTPVLYLNGVIFELTPSLLNLEASVRLEALASRQYSAYPMLELDPGRGYRARLSLTQGEVVIDLFPEAAPLAATSFIFLAQQGWYDGSIFHQVTPGVLAASGDPTWTGLGGPGYVFDTEVVPDLTFSQPGMVGMSSSGPGVCGSQFFIALGPLPELDGSRTIFGQVSEGLELLQDLEARDPLTNLLDPPQTTILSVTIEEQ